jgi:hypothetical protein
MSGILWFALVIPFITVAVLLGIPKLRKATKWWEVAIPIVFAAITVVVCQFIAIKSATNDKEYRGHMSYRIVNEEPASYDGECSETYACGTSCDSKGNCTTTYCTRYYHCVKNDGRSTYIIDDRNQKYRISYGKYQELDKRWNNHKHTEKKMTRSDGGYTTVGDKYDRAGYGSQHIVYWDKVPESSEPIVKEYTYENRLQTQSHWGKISEEDRLLYNVFDYPSVPGGWRLRTLLTNGPAFKKADKYLQYLNGHLNTNKGGNKKVRIWVLVYSKQPQEAAELQRAYWKGGNKNEIVIMLGTNEEKSITWADVMTQADDSDFLMILIRDIILSDMSDGINGYSGKLTDDDLYKFSQWLGKAVKTGYRKPDFKQCDYIQVVPSPLAIIITYLLVFVISIAAAIFVIYNQWDDKKQLDKPKRRVSHRFR